MKGIPFIIKNNAEFKIKEIKNITDITGFFAVIEKTLKAKVKKGRKLYNIVLIIINLYKIWKPRKR